MNVAVIDDTQTNLLLMQHLLKRMSGVTTHLFQSSQQGLDWCLAHDPDLIIVDYMMPEPDGLNFLRQIRASDCGRTVPIVMVTANQQVDIRYEALESGLTDFLTKPIDTQEFAARIRNMLTLRAQERALADRAIHLAQEVSAATSKIREREREVILHLSRAAGLRDPETGSHLLRMAHYSELIARQLGWSATDSELLLLAAPMHDIGKVGIPDAILLKPGALTDAEQLVMRTHPVIGHRLLSASDIPLLQLGAEIALSHHEKFDGSGYPFGLAGNDIPLTGRIVAIADVFDALTSVRPYKTAWTDEAALRWIGEQSGKHFDPACVNALLACYPDLVRIRDKYQDEE